MAHNDKTLNKSWPDWVNLALGAWLFISVWVLAFTGLQFAMWNALVFGALIVVMSVAALMDWREWEEWVDMVVGAWLFVSPWILGFATFTAGQPAYGATVSTILTGLGVFALAAWSVWQHRHPELGAH